MTFVDSLGFIAAFCTTSAFIPQAYQVFKTRDTASLSLAMYAILTFGIGLWLAYGLVKGDMAVIVANMITIVLASCILGIKINNTLKALRAKRADAAQHDCGAVQCA